MLDLVDLPELYKLFGTGVAVGALAGAMLFFLSFLIGFFYKLFRRL